MEILLEPTSNKLLVGDMWDLAKDQACDNWIETMGRFILESTLVQEMNWRILLEKPFDVQIFFSLAHRMCIHVQIQKVSLIEKILLEKPFDVRTSSFL